MLKYWWRPHQAKHSTDQSTNITEGMRVWQEYEFVYSVLSSKYILNIQSIYDHLVGYYCTCYTLSDSEITLKSNADFGT